MTPLAYLLVFLGGGTGSYLRYRTDSYLKTKTALPITTASINLAGSFLLGFVAVISANTPSYFLLATGFCGGFTTFSTAMVEVVKEARGRRPAWALNLFITQLLFACAAAWLGLMLGNSLT